MLSRRVMQTILGVVWLFDGLLQLKPQMFTTTFISQVITPTAEGQPSWIAGLVHWGANVAAAHIVSWNLLFALVQVLLGLFFIFNVRTRETIVASIVWSAIVWVFGEALGQIFSGQTLVLSGAPGAVLLYALLGVAIWPAKTGGLKDWSPKGKRFARLSLASLWFLGACLHLQRPFLTSDGLSQVVSAPWLSNMLAHSGVASSLALGAVEFVLAVLLLVPALGPQGRTRMRWAAVASIVLSLLFWWIGQSFGNVFDSLATDINSAPMMVLIALAAFPGLFQGTREHDGEPTRSTSSARTN